MLKVVQTSRGQRGGRVSWTRCWMKSSVTGARQMLAAALQAEVAAYVDAHAGEVDDQVRRLVVRKRPR